MKKLLCLVLILLSLSGASQTNISVTDSLWKAWNIENESDSLKAEELISFTREVYVFNKPDSGVFYANQLLEFALEKNLPVAQSEALNIKGICYTLLDDFANALISFTASLELDRANGDFKAVANKLNNIGIVYKNQGEYLKAAEYYKETISLSKEINQPRITAMAYNNVAMILMVQGIYEPAVELALQSFEIKKQLNDKKGILISFVTLGEAYQQIGQSEIGHKYLDSAIVLAQLLNNSYYLKAALFSKGDAFRDFGEYDSAKYYYEKSRMINLEMNDPSGQAVSLHRLADIHYLRGEFQKAIPMIVESYNISLSINDISGIEGATRTCAMNYFNIQKPDSAVYYLNKLNESIYNGIHTNYFSYTATEREEQFIHRALYFDLNHDLAYAYREQIPSMSDTSLNMLYLTKGLSLKSTTWLRNQILSSNDSSLINDYSNWILLKKELFEDENNGIDITEKQHLVSEMERALYTRSSFFADFMNDLKPDWKIVRDNLKQGEAAIEFVHYINVLDNVYDVSYAAYIITLGCQHPTMVKLCSEDQLKIILGKNSANNINYVESVYGKNDTANTTLFKSIWSPMQPFLEGITTIYYSPSGLLNQISFAAIAKDKNVFLSDLYNFRQMTSTINIASASKTNFSELENFLLMGGVQYNSDSSEREIWSYLPGSLNETDAINNFLTKKKYGVNYFKERDASEEVFKEKITNSSIVHIATHGFFFPDPEKVRAEMKSENEDGEIKFRGTTNYANWSFVNNKNPLMRSGIIFANANDVWSRDPFAAGEDGVLTAQEVSTLDLRNTKLVVLSACETGLGDVKGSEGVYGLQRAFKMAGVKYIIMSLWQVPDKETSEFMILFYKNLIKLKDIPLAFHKTQKVMREKYDPYFWGAFVLIE